MHLGNAFSSLLAWLSVRSQGGRMILRLEDLDPDRCKTEYCQQLEEDLHWLGLDWDEGGLEDRPDYRQSHCTSLYAQQLEVLEARGLLYPCYCSRGELHAASAPHRSDGVLLYSGRCRNLTQEERNVLSQRRKPAIRIRVPEEEVSFQDGVYGRYTENLARDCGDFILRRSDGVHAYQLAVVVDDGRMGVTEVVRGRDLLDSTPRQIWLQRQLGYSTPNYCHVPLLVAEDGRRLSKRDGDLDLGALRQQFTPQEVVGYLVSAAGLLEQPEPVMPTELIDSFSWTKVKKEDVVLHAFPG
jgi:glutamyl-tRNA synthetase